MTIPCPNCAKPIVPEEGKCNNCHVDFGAYCSKCGSKYVAYSMVTIGYKCSTCGEFTPISDTKKVKPKPDELIELLKEINNLLEFQVGFKMAKYDYESNIIITHYQALQEKIRKQIKEIE